MMPLLMDALFQCNFFRLIIFILFYQQYGMENHDAQLFICWDILTHRPMKESCVDFRVAVLLVVVLFAYQSSFYFIFRHAWGTDHCLNSYHWWSDVWVLFSDSSNSHFIIYWSPESFFFCTWLSAKDVLKTKFYKKKVTWIKIARSILTHLLYFTRFVVLVY